MIQIFKAASSTIVLACTGLNRFMSAFDHAGRYVEEAAADMADSAAEERSDKKAERQRKREAAGLPVIENGKSKQPKLPAPKTTSTTTE